MDVNPWPLSRAPSQMTNDGENLLREVWYDKVRKHKSLEGEDS